MRRYAIALLASMLFTLIPARPFAFEAELEGRVDELAARAPQPAPSPRWTVSNHARGLVEAPPGETSPGGAAPEPHVAPEQASSVNPHAQGGSRTGEHMSLVGELPSLPSLPTIALRDFIGKVEQSNLDLAAQQLNIPIAQGQAAAARVYPDPVLNAIYGGDLSHHKQPGTWGAGLSQTILLGGKIGARTTVANSAVGQSKAQVDDFLRNLRAEAADAFVGTLAQSLVVQFHTQALARAEDLLAPAIVSRPGQKAARISLLRARIAVLDQRDALLKAQSVLQQELFDLALMIGRSDQLYLPRGDLHQTPRHFRPDQLIAHALASRGDIRAAREALEGAKAQRDLVRANRWPDVTLGGAYTHFTRSTNLTDLSPAWDGAFATLSVPLPLSNLNTGQLESAHASELQMARMLAATQIKAEMEIRKTLERYTIAVERVHQYTNEILSDAEEIYAARKQQSPPASLLDMIDVQRAYNEIYLDYFNSLYDQAKALIDLECAANIWDIDL